MGAGTPQLQLRAGKHPGTGWASLQIVQLAASSGGTGNAGRRVGLPVSAGAVLLERSGEPKQPRGRRSSGNQRHQQGQGETNSAHAGAYGGHEKPGREAGLGRPGQPGRIMPC